MQQSTGEHLVRGRILVVDDEEDLARIVTRYLERLGLTCSVAHDGPSALALAGSGRPDLVVLDLMLPGLDGLEVARRLRRDSDAFVLMLTARGEEDDVVAGLAAGADDYLTKPFSPRVLAARVLALLRRRGAPAAGGPLRVGDLVIDPPARTVHRGARPVPLTRTEFDILATLAAARGQALSRREILEAMWGREWFGDEHVVDVHVANLRRKLDDPASTGRHVETVRGIGYRAALRATEPTVAGTESA